jgi:hypothetical protein
MAYFAGSGKLCLLLLETANQEVVCTFFTDCLLSATHQLFGLPSKMNGNPLVVELSQSKEYLEFCTKSHVSL